MAKKGFPTILLLVLVVIVVVVVFKFGGITQQQAILGTESMTRTVPSQVEPGGTFTVTYNAIGTSGDYGVSVVDTISGGCTPSDVKFVLTSPSTRYEVDYTAPSSNKITCVFNGDYKFGSFSETNFPSQSIYVCQPKTCSESGFECGSQSNDCGNNLYCGDCLTNYNCISGVCVCNPSCSVSKWALQGACATTMSDGCVGVCTRTVTQNTNADTNCDNFVNRDELGVAIIGWANGVMLRTELGMAVQAWAGG